MEKFEIESCKKWIDDNHFHTVALQLPDDDLDKVQDLIDLLKSSIETENLELYLVGDGCSPCCNDLLNAQYCQAQGLIHFGHSCLAASDDQSQSAIAVFYVFYQRSLPEDVLNFLSTNSGQTQPYSLVFYDPCFRDAIEQCSTALPRFIFSKIDLINSTDPSVFSLYGRSIHLPSHPLDSSNYTVVFISSSNSSLHNFALYFYAYDFRSFPSNSISSTKLLSKRMYAMECARNGSNYGLLTSSNSLLNLPSTIHTVWDRVKSILHKHHRQYYTFLMNTLSIAKLNNFEQAIDVYVLCSSCPESLWLAPERKQFNIPLISIADVVQAFAKDQEQMNYSFDLRQILSTMRINDETPTNTEGEHHALVLKNPNALLLQQRDVASGGRTWWGLQITENSPEENEQKSIAELKEGRTGIAADTFSPLEFSTWVNSSLRNQLDSPYEYEQHFRVESMTKDCTTNQKVSRKYKDVFYMDDTTDSKRKKVNSYSPRTYISMANQMQFVEISPCDLTNQPHPRSGHRAVANNSDFWIWGGYHPSQNLQSHVFNELWRFNFALQRWTLETPTGDGPTSTLASHSMQLHHNLALVFGGTGYPFGWDIANDLYILDLKRRHWRQLQLNNQQPSRVYGASMIIHNDHVYILCGTNGRIYNTNVYDIHIPTLTCTQIGQTFDEEEDFADNGRYRQEVYLHKDKIYVFGGGGVSGISFSLENLPVFDLHTRTWSFIRTNPDPTHNFPMRRKFHSVFPFRPDQVIVFGGANYPQSPVRQVYTDIRLWIFDFNQLAWSRIPSVSMIRSTYFHAAAMNERGEIWSHGGVVQNSSAARNEERITTLYKMNTKVLKLSELCWDHFLQCLSDRTCLVQRPELIRELNIPAQFAERIH